MQIKDIEKLKNSRNTKLIKLSFGNFYVKRRENIRKAINELIIHYASKDMGIVSPNIQLVKFNKDYFILAQDLNDFGNFKTVEELGLTSAENSSLLSVFRWLYKNFNNYNQLIIDVTKIYLLDVFFMIQDRHNGNWGILENNGNNKVCILDNEKAFNTEMHPIMESFLLNHLFIVSNYQERRKKDLEFLLQNYGKIVNDIFVDFFNFFTPEYFIALLERIEQNVVLLTDKGTSHITIQNKDSLISQYQINYNNIRDVKSKNIKKL